MADDRPAEDPASTATATEGARPVEDATDEGATGATDGGATDGGATRGAEDAGANGGTGSGRGADGFDLRGIVKQFTAPMIESLDARLREQVEAHTDALMDQKVDAAVSNRMATIERAIADLSRSITSLERRLESLERSGEPSELE